MGASVREAFSKMKKSRKKRRNFNHEPHKRHEQRGRFFLWNSRFKTKLSL